MEFGERSQYSGDGDDQGNHRGWIRYMILKLVDIVGNIQI